MCPTTLDEEGMVSAETRVARVRVGYRRLALRCCIPPAMCFNTSRLEISYSTKCADVKILLLDQGQWCGTARSNSLWVDRVRVGVRWPTQHSISGGNQYQQSSPTDLRFLKKKNTLIRSQESPANCLVSGRPVVFCLQRGVKSPLIQRRLSTTPPSS